MFSLLSSIKSDSICNKNNWLSKLLITVSTLRSKLVLLKKDIRLSICK